MSGADALKFAPFALGAFGAYRQGKTESRLLRQQAKLATQQAYADEEAHRREARAFMGAQAAAMAQAGTGIEGSNELLVQQSAALAELDALNIRYRGLIRAADLGYRAKEAKKGGTLSAGLSLLKGAASMYAAGS